MFRAVASLMSLLMVAVACSAPAASDPPSATIVPVATGPGEAAPSPEAASGPNIIPLLVNSELAQGPNRFLFGLTDAENQRLAAPDIEVDLLFYDEDADPDTVVFEADSRFLWAIEGFQGLYAADVTFPHPGRWATRFNATLADGTPETVRASYDVRETTQTPMIGAPAVRVDSPVAADVGGDLRQISTDPEPMASMYEVSIAEALDAGEPFIVTFGTPAFCRSATCGPTLETVKTVAADHPELRFIHVEPYILEWTGDTLTPVLDEDGRLQTTAWTDAWDLPVEPFIAAVDGDGDVRAKFEITVASQELRDAIAMLDPIATTTGIVIDINQASLGDVQDFTLRTEEGQTQVFTVGIMELDDDAFPADHLREHMAFAQPVEVTFHQKSEEQVAVRLEDAAPSA